MRNTPELPQNWFPLLILCAALSNCGQRSSDHADFDDSDGSAVGGNQALYDKVMDVHDEVMPKMDELYTSRERLQNLIAETPELPADKLSVVQSTIAELDSASESMMVWMRQFNPLPDSVGVDRAREYLENEMEKIQKVRSRVYEALEHAETVQPN
jgi:hypothetical protein